MHRGLLITDAEVVKSVVEIGGQVMRLKGKVALVTGASRGIGFAVAELLRPGRCDCLCRQFEATRLASFRPA